jgi:hypothetical protein
LELLVGEGGLEFGGDFADDLGAQLAAFLGGVGLQPLDGLQKLFGQALAARSVLANRRISSLRLRSSFASS